jgi:phenylalanyl-tRNA synthetase beta chain
MLISINWIRDYVDLPVDLDPVALAEVFTRTTAEVDGVHRLDVAARGLIAAAVRTLSPVLGPSNLRLAVLDVGGKTVETVTAAPKLSVGDRVVYAPPGASVKSLGQIGVSTVGGRQSTGMILAADSLGIELGGQEAVFLSDEFKPGDALPGELFDDWLIEVDNKSLTNRPDLWGHYGIAREIAAILRAPLKPLPSPRPSPWEGEGGDEIRIAIGDSKACPRYSAIVLEGVGSQAAPLWMQLRLGHVGQRPISGLVDLTNYLMVDLGQPMHAFDAAKVDRIEVDWAAEGEKFRTLDGVERVLTKTDLMIKSKGKSVALAGVMGGLETEVSNTTKSLLLESANFNGATIRRTATRLSLRSDASARFEKSLDPANTVLGIQRFVQLARAMFPAMKIASRLSDAYPNPARPVGVTIDPRRTARTIGRDMTMEEARKLLAPLGFEMSGSGTAWEVAVPSFRATGDISIEADVVEELARRIGYDNIVPAMPHTTARTFAINPLHELEQRSLQYFSTAHGFHEIHGYLWYDDAWVAQLGFDPGVTPELRNPAGQGLHRLRATLMPGLLAALPRNRFHFDALSLLELGSVFQSARVNSPSLNGGVNKNPSPSQGEGRVGVETRDSEYRHLGLVLAQRGKNVEGLLNNRLRAAICDWAWERFGKNTSFVETQSAIDRPWEHPERTAAILMEGTPAGRIGVIDLALRRRMDDHLGAWGIVWAELHLSHLAGIPRKPEKLGVIPPFPMVEMDFTLAVERTARYAEVSQHLGKFDHPLLRSIRFVTSYDDEKAGRRSLTFRCLLGDCQRTLTDADTAAFRESFEKFVSQSGYEIKKS